MDNDCCDTIYDSIKKEEKEFLKNKKIPLEIDKNYFIRTITNYYTGTLKEIYDNWLVLSRAAWIVDTGRFSDFLRKGIAVEIDPYIDEVIISTAFIVDVTEFDHELPREKKG